MPDNNVRLNVEQIEERTLPSGTVVEVHPVFPTHPSQAHPVFEVNPSQTQGVMVDSGGNVVSNNNNNGGQPVVVAGPPAPPPGLSNPNQP